MTNPHKGTGERLLSNSIPEPNTGCLLWLGSVDKRGYGFIRVSGKQYRTHRLSYEMNIGQIPPGMFVCHECDQPACVNPRHLFLGTHKVNMADMRRKGRAAKGDRNGGRVHPERVPRGECNGNSKLTDADVRAIRMSHLMGATYKALAGRFGVNESAVGCIVQRKKWRHLDGGLFARAFLAGGKTK